MRDETERLVKEAVERKTLTVKQGKTRIDSKCRKCGALNRVSAAHGQVRVPYTCKECGEKPRAPVRERDHRKKCFKSKQRRRHPRRRVEKLLSAINLNGQLPWSDWIRLGLVYQLQVDLKEIKPSSVKLGE